jgi:2'-5' RNA ligase
MELLARGLRAAGMSLGAAESCTGGLLGAALSSLPGSSAFFAGSVAAYENRAKREFLGVPGDILLEHGAVSPETALNLARGARDRFHTDLGLAITGIAGPGGGSPEKPVGLLHLGTAWKGGERQERILLGGSRDEIRSRAVEAALDLARESLAAAAPESLRLFAAVRVPGPLAAALFRRLGPWRDSDRGGKWVAPEAYHLTVAFGSAVAPAGLPDIREALAAAAKKFPPFPMEISGAGFFPPRGEPKVAWAGIGEGARELSSLAGELASGLAHLGFPPEQRPYHPHLTLGRPRAGKPAAARGRFLAELEKASSECAGRFQAEVLSFFRSVLTPSGPVYRELGSYPFRGEGSTTHM